MLFKGISKEFSLKNEDQYNTIGDFWDEMELLYGLENLQGLGYKWVGGKIFYAIGLKIGDIKDYNLCIELPDDNWTVVTGKTENLKEISVERIYAELKLILTSSEKYAFSDKSGHYSGLKLLDKVGALDVLFPELTLGRNMAQRADFHSYDVLEHSLRTVLYAEKEVRLVALFHDVGKPERFLSSGKFHNHDLSGEKIVRRILTRLKADNDTINRVARLVKYHMYDMECNAKENKIRKFMVDNFDILDHLFYKLNVSSSFSPL